MIIRYNMIHGFGLYESLFIIFQSIVWRINLFINNSQRYVLFESSNWLRHANIWIWFYLSNKGLFFMIILFKVIHLIDVNIVVILISMRNFFPCTLANKIRWCRNKCLFSQPSLPLGWFPIRKVIHFHILRSMIDTRINLLFYAFILSPQTIPNWTFLFPYFLRPHL